MKLFTLSLLSLLLSTAGIAQTVGYFYPNNARTQPPPVSGVGAWTNLANIFADPGYATSPNLNVTNQTTDRLYGYNFNMGVPAGWTIDGIELEVIRRQDGGTQGNLADHVITLMLADEPIGENKAITTTSWETFDQTVVYGGPTDKWGRTWTAAEVNSTFFGAGLIARRFQFPNGTPSRAYVRSFRIKVYFSAPLPIVLKSFDVRKVGNSSAKISWVTTEEVNVRDYEIQRSSDGVKYNTISTVTPVSPNSQVEQSYSITDANPLPGRNYYRLKQTDLDGQFEIFPAKYLNFENGQAYLKLLSVPGGRVRVSSANKKGQYSLLVRDIAGRLLQQEKVSLSGTSAENYIQLKSTVKGIVVVSVTNGDEQFSERLFIQ